MTRTTGTAHNTDSDLGTVWLEQLIELRKQGMQIADINPVSALADIIGEQIDRGVVTVDQLRQLLDVHAGQLWGQRVANLRMQTGLDGGDQTLPDLNKQDISRTAYRAVFTAHPVFALRPDVSAQMTEHADAGTGTPPPDAFAPRDAVTLDDEHAEAMQALQNARTAVNDINADILRQRRAAHPQGWRDVLPETVGVSTWVGYDLDGRSDISWQDSFRLRLREKRDALTVYHQTIMDSGLVASSDAMADIAARLTEELTRTMAHIQSFDIGDAKADAKADAEADSGDVIAAMNALTGAPGRLISSRAL
ncbi:MAG: hypothetical protein ISP39_02810, partial [Alphaproteobacteria bacterium]|nr:hypothetical protein [Alphaproteobacteria bacterium]